MNAFHIFLIILFSLVGMGFFYSGKKRGNTILLVCGIALSLFPYFVHNTIVMAGLGLILIVAPFIVQL